MSDEGHVPGQVESEFPDPVEKEPTVPAPTKEEQPGTPPEGEAPKEEEQPEPPKDKADEEETPHKEEVKKRSVYDDLKNERKQRKEVTARAEAAEAKAAELQALLDAQDKAKTPEQKEKAADDIEEFAKEQGLDPQALNRLVDIVQKRLPKPEGVLTPEEAEQWRRDRATAQRQQEDQAIMAEAPAVKAQLGVHDDAELGEVMKEVVRLAHTPEYHDKPIKYIVWDKQAELSKLISPKKPSFEQGGQRSDAGPAADVDFSSGGVTPMQAQEAIADRGRTAGYEIRGGAR